MNFFHPLTLGAAKSGISYGGGRDRKVDGPPGQTYEAWRESLSALQDDYDEQPEYRVFDQLRAEGLSEHGISLILGEPGAGKSTLLEEWHARWIRGLGPLRLGIRVPVLLRAKHVVFREWGASQAVMADRLWEQGQKAAATVVSKASFSTVLFDTHPRLYAPVWLLDGLDEAGVRIDEREFWECIAALPGEVVATIRTAVFQSLPLEATRSFIAREFRILGLRPNEQAEFLARALEAARRDPAPAGERMRQLNGNPALRPLAAVPLLLGLVAQMRDEQVLPNTRAGFYERAINSLWLRRIGDKAVALDLADARDTALEAVASAMGLSVIEATREVLRASGVKGELRDAIDRSGLLIFDTTQFSAVFRHLTFQEFYLARAWRARDFAEVLEEYWAAPHYEEVLALLVALHWEGGQAALVERALRAFSEGWRARHTRDPSELWGIGRSPYAVAMALLGRAAVKPSDPLLGAAVPQEMARLNLAYRPHLPATTLALLANDADWSVRSAVAKHKSTPPDSLAQLARADALRRWVAARHSGDISRLVNDPDPIARLWLAREESTLPELLALLALDPDVDVRRSTARHQAISPHSLNVLAKDRDTWVRTAVAIHPALPSEARALLAEDPAEGIRRLAGKRPPPAFYFLLDSLAVELSICRSVAQNTSAPPYLLALLSNAPDQLTRHLAIANTAMPPDRLTALAQDPKSEVRGLVARNGATPPSGLAVLAQDCDNLIRQSVAAQRATSKATLAILANDPDPRVRQCVAENPGTPSEIVAQIASKPDYRRRAAADSGTVVTPDRLELVTIDSDYNERYQAAKHRAAPPHILALLARDLEASIRKEVGENPATPPASLLLLASDMDKQVRWTLSRNPSLPPDALTILANDPDMSLRRHVAQHPATPAKILAHLAKDTEPKVAHTVGENMSALLEDLGLS